MKGQRIGYIRVSTAEQNTERQLDGVALDRVFTDRASGKDTNRPQLKAALEFVREGDTLLIHSMDRAARNTEDLLRLVRELTGRGVTIEFVKNQLTFSGRVDPMGKLMLTMLAAFAEFERALIRERQREGIAIARRAGKYKGRRKALDAEQAKELVELAQSGIPKSDLARTYGVTRQTVYQYVLRG